MPLGVAVFLVVGGLLGSSLFIHKNRAFEHGFGGVAIVSSAHGAQEANAPSMNGMAFANTQVGSLFTSAAIGSGNGGNYITQEEGAVFNNNEGSVRDPGGVFSDLTSKSGIVSYTVQQGDTLPSVAAYFGISMDTITNANLKKQSAAIKAGDVLKILPVSGILYKSKQGDTLQSIASTFGVSEDQISQANLSLDLGSLSYLAFVDPGLSLIIPGGKADITTPPSRGN